MSGACDVLQILIVVNIVQYEEPTYGDTQYPGWALALGWLIAFLPICLIFGWAIYYYALKGGCVVRSLVHPHARTHTHTMRL